MGVAIQQLLNDKCPCMKKNVTDFSPESSLKSLHSYNIAISFSTVIIILYTIQAIKLC